MTQEALNNASTRVRTILVNKDILFHNYSPNHYVVPIRSAISYTHPGWSNSHPPHIVRKHHIHFVSITNNSNRTHRFAPARQRANEGQNRCPKSLSFDLARDRSGVLADRSKWGAAGFIHFVFSNFPFLVCFPFVVDTPDGRESVHFQATRRRDCGPVR